MDAALVLARLIHFLAAMAAFGSAAFRLYALDRHMDGAVVDAISSLDHRIICLLRISGLLVLVSAAAIIPFVAARMAGSVTAAIDLPTIAKVLSVTEFGRVWCCHLLFTVLLVVTATLAPQRFALNMIWAALALASLGWAGHAAGGSGWAGFGREANQSVHLLAAGLWIGGLLPLAYLLRRSRIDQGGSGVLALYALRPFSQMGYVAVSAIALTGAVNTLTIVGDLDALLGTDYGRLLLLKILLYLAMVATAVRNRFRLSPRLARADESAAQALYGSVLIEQAIGLGILAVVSVLGTWPPPMPHHH